MTDFANLYIFFFVLISRLLWSSEFSLPQTFTNVLILMFLLWIAGLSGAPALSILCPRPLIGLDTADATAAANVWYPCWAFFFSVHVTQNNIVQKKRRETKHFNAAYHNNLVCSILASYCLFAISLVFALIVLSCTEVIIYLKLSSSRFICRCCWYFLIILLKCFEDAYTYHSMLNVGNTILPWPIFDF